MTPVISSNFFFILSLPTKFYKTKIDHLKPTIAQFQHLTVLGNALGFKD